MKKCFQILLILLVSCQQKAGELVEDYLAQHPRTLVTVAEALRNREIIEDMTPEETSLLLGESIGSYAYEERGEKKLILTYKKDGLFRKNSEVYLLQAPVALEFLSFAIDDNTSEWRLLDARSTWR